MLLPRILEFNHKRIRPTIVPPMTKLGPVDSRVYTMYVSNLTSEYFFIISDRCCQDNCNQLVRNDACAKWIMDCSGVYKLHFFINLGNENNLLVFTRYIMYKELIINYIHCLAHVEREFLKNNRCLLNSPVIVNFESGCDKFNFVENYGTLRGYCKRV